MRVVAGSARGIRLAAPSGHATRPTSDRVREATFNALGSLGVVDDAAVLDLFAGSGAMGVEALSRGARRATFVEHDRAAAEVIRANLAATRLEANSTVVCGDVPRFVASTATGYDLAVLDPPYAFDAWSGLLAALAVPLAVLESDREIDAGPGWGVVRSRRYGTTVVTIVRRVDPADTPEILDPEETSP